MSFALQRVLDPMAEPVSVADVKNYLRVDIDDDNDLIANIISLSRERVEDETSRCLLAQQWQFAFDRFPCFYYDALHGSYYHHYRPGLMYRSDHSAIILPRGPVISVDSITYKDFTGATQTLSSLAYTVDLLSQPARIVPAYGGIWPSSLLDTNSIVVTFTAGYQQTVTETVTLSATAPYEATLTRGDKAVGVVGATDSVTNATVSTSFQNETIVFTGGSPNQSVVVTYLVSNIPQSLLFAIKLLCGAWYENRAEVVQGGGNFNKLPLPVSATALIGMYNLFPVGYPKG